MDMTCSLEERHRARAGGCRGGGADPRREPRREGAAWSAFGALFEVFV